MLRRIVLDPRFALVELLLVILSGVIWVIVPELGIWFTLLALLPFGLRLLVGKPPFQRTPLDWFMVIFLITAWIGYWVAYDGAAAWIKIWLIVTSILLYYALSGQPKQNLEVLSLFSFCTGLAVSVYFFLTHDFTGSPGIISWWINHRLHVGWPVVHHGYISGLLVITTTYALGWLWNTGRKPLSRFTIALKIFLILGLGIIIWAFVLTMSRGVWMALVCGMGAWIIWRFATSNRFISRPGIVSLFPFFVLFYLSATLILAYLGPAQASGGVGQGDYGTNSRAELSERGAYFLLDFPITGGGLNSFPGLYSQYMIVIPFFYFINSYNMFLDVAIEQGNIGGLAFIFIYLGGIWLVSRALINKHLQQMHFFHWLGLFALVFTVIHGFFYDYLYNGIGTLLLFFPVGISMISILDVGNRQKPIPAPETLPVLRKRVHAGMLIISVLVLTAILALNINKIISIWYSNLGAVQMSQVELRYFPTKQWATAEIVPHLGKAEASLHSALKYDPDNQTANYRLGMIFMLRQDFESAAENLEKAYQLAPSHRGIVKSLGYSYVWLGEMEKAKVLLAQIPEAQEELNVYAWWWNTQDRGDLAANASALLSRLKLLDIQQ